MVGYFNDSVFTGLMPTQLGTTLLSWSRADNIHWLTQALYALVQGALSFWSWGSLTAFEHGQILFLSRSQEFSLAIWIYVIANISQLYDVVWFLEYSGWWLFSSWLHIRSVSGYHCICIEGMAKELGYWWLQPFIQILFQLCQHLVCQALLFWSTDEMHFCHVLG